MLRQYFYYSFEFKRIPKHLMIHDGSDIWIYEDH